ncbi:MAG: hypothetical protein K2I43_00995, partial [Alistipes sp.]|nr:hypothetical protein [Alistipes sp.]
ETEPQALKIQNREFGIGMFRLRSGMTDRRVDVESHSEPTLEALAEAACRLCRAKEGEDEVKSLKKYRNPKITDYSLLITD